jgi:hypothetical protein
MSPYQSTLASDYPGLREVLAPQYRRLPAEDIEALFETYNLSAEDMEGFLDTLKDIGNAVVRAAPAVLPVAGTVVGTAFGGPAGAALGGALGSLAGGAIGQATGPQRPATSPARSGPQPSRAIPGQGRLQPGPRIPQAPSGASPAAGQLMQTMFRPEMLQSLISMLLGQLGRPNVSVGGTPVPVGGFTNLLATLANQAQAEYAEANPYLSEGLPEYLRDYAGEAVGDPAVAEHRASVLLEMLQENDVESMAPRPRMRLASYAEMSSTEEEAFYAQLEAAEAYSEADEW